MTAYRYIDPEVFKKPRYPYIGQYYYNLKEHKMYIFYDGFWRNINDILIKERIDKLNKLNEFNS